MSLKFIKANNSKDIKTIYDYNIDAFSDSPGFNWNYDEIKKEVKAGWELYGVEENGEIIAALFYKLDGKTLFSKNTSIKISHQGSGFSHKIKDFFEVQAKECKVKEIVHTQAHSDAPLGHSLGDFCVGGIQRLICVQREDGDIVQDLPRVNVHCIAGVHGNIRDGDLLVGRCRADVPLGNTKETERVGDIGKVNAADRQAVCPCDNVPGVDGHCPTRAQRSERDGGVAFCIWSFGGLPLDDGVGRRHGEGQCCQTGNQH